MHQVVTVSFQKISTHKKMKNKIFITYAFQLH